MYAASSDCEPTVFHITHWKSGSQWVHRILHGLVYDRLVLPRQDQAQFLRAVVQRGKIYPTLYVTKEQFESVGPPADHRRFVMIRDLRDTLISLYFSCKVSHSIPNEFDSLRSLLCGMSEEAGLLHVMEAYLSWSADIQQSWLAAGEPLLKYEDLLENDLEILRDILLRRCEMNVSEERFKEVVLAARFQNWTGGRPRGVEDVNSHERKGIVGDWRNYFTRKIKQSFKDRFGQLLAATGYESNLDW